MMNTGSTERALTTKSLCQWTATTTLVAVGSLAFISAHTLEKLNGNGGVSLNLEAFRKLGSLSLALDRTEEEKLLIEEDRLIEKASFAQAEALPKTSVRFAKIASPTKIVHKKAHSHAIAKAAAPGVKNADRSALTLAENAEIAMLERAVDPALEAQKLANLYRRVRFHFVAAIDTAERNQLLAQASEYDAERAEYGAESVQIAQENEALEFARIPTFDAAEFAWPEKDANREIVAQVETAPENSSAGVIAARAIVKDEIQNSASATAAPDVLSADPLPPAPSANLQAMLGKKEEKKGETIFIAPAITTTGLDLVPEPVESVSIQAEEPVPTQVIEVKQATGPPEETKSEKIDLPASLATSPAQNSPSLNSVLPPLPEKIEITTAAITPVTTETPADQVEYSADVAAAYHPEVADDSSDESGLEIEGLEYATDAEYSARPGFHADGSTNLKGASVTSITTARSSSQGASATQYGHGISRDSSGITIDWSEKTRQAAGLKVELPATFAQKELAQNGVEESLKKFSFTQSSALTAAGMAGVAQTARAADSARTPGSESLPEVKPSKCDTEKLGVEAFNPAAEKEDLSICRRPLSLEGSLTEDQPRWWEVYGSESAHWPTLIYQRAKDARQEKERVPMLPVASIRILSTIARMNTHAGMGIIFGELPRGLEVRLMGRDDAPVFIDGGLKEKDGTNENIAKRPFVFLNVAPGQPFLIVTDTEKKITGAIPVLVKSGIATFMRVPPPIEKTMTFTVLDASAIREKRLPQMTAEIIGQTGRMGISDRKGELKIEKVVTFGEYPLYLDLIRSEKSFKNRYRLSPNQTANRPLFFLDEKRVSGWTNQLAGGVSPFSGLVVGVVPTNLAGNQVRIGTFEKKSSLVPERYLLDASDHLVSDAKAGLKLSRFVGVQIPEGVAIPSVFNAQGDLAWSEIVYAQPGVINVVGP